MIWEKGCAITNPAWAALARNDRLVDIVSELIGEHVILWGSSLLIRVPNQVHQWHDDLESANGDGFVTLWMGLEKTDPDTSLKLVPGSHRFNKLLYQLAKEKGVLRQNIDDEKIIEWSNLFQPGSDIENLDTYDGDALFIDGRLWHGSTNRSKVKKRIAVLLQYVRAGKAVRIPKFSHQRWPMEYFTSPKPPCLVIRGSSQDNENHIMPGPHATPISSKFAITTLIESLDIREDEPGHEDLKIFDLVRGPTTGLRLMECHYAVLAPGKMPHPPHIHDEEEIQMIVHGEAELIAEDAKGSNNMKRFLAKPGDFIYHPANWRHTYENMTEKPVVGIVFKWITDEYHSSETLKSTFVKCSDTLVKDREPSNNIEFDGLLKGKTGYLRTLESHMATLQPGQGYDPHIDGHDVGIIHFEGQIETLGETVNTPSFIYYSAGQKHGMKNTGDTVSKHIAFEFHGKHGDIYESQSKRRKRRLRQAITNPKIIFKHLKWRLDKILKKPGHVWAEKEQ
ncbi:MAG: cupin domain-containing protein [Verrucomicrobia bacterium]|nr:cupin domain-containing protein [Verrucomicrobiota bacterium]